MASTVNYSRNQGTTWRITISITDANGGAQMIADKNKDPITFFAGIATRTGQTSVPIRFKLQDVETVTSGRGSNATSEEGVYKVYAFIPADESGVDSSVNTTATMDIGDWGYEIRIADSTDPADTDAATTILQGILTIVDSPLEETTLGHDFDFSAPEV